MSGDQVKRQGSRLPLLGHWKRPGARDKVADTSSNQLLATGEDCFHSCVRMCREYRTARVCVLVYVCDCVCVCMCVSVCACVMSDV